MTGDELGVRAAVRGRRAQGARGVDPGVETAKAGRGARSRALRALALGLALPLLAAFAGCGPSSESPPSATPVAEHAAPAAPATPTTPVRGGTVVVGTISDIDGVNELTATNTRGLTDVLFQMFLHLAEENPNSEDHPPTWDPELARAWDWSDDHLTLTFHLRDDVEWSDGVPVTADDVRFSWQAQTDPSVAWPAAYLKDSIQDVEVVDPLTVRFHYTKVSPSQFNTTCEGLILPKHTWGKIPFSRWRQSSDEFLRTMVVDGPFKLEHWTPQQELVLVRNEHYFDPELPRLDRVVYRLIPEKSNQVNQLLAGDLQFVEQLPIQDIPRVEASKLLRVEAYWHRLYSFIAWNIKRPLFADRRVRQALTMAIDRQGIIDALWGPWARLATSPIVANNWAHDTSLKAWPYDPERARKLLAEAGWTDHDGDGVIDKDGQPFAFELMTNQGNQERINAVVMIQAQLKKVGIQARPRIVEFNSMTNLVQNQHFDAVLTAWGMPTSLDMRYAFDTSEIGDGGENFSAYSDPEVDRLIDRMEALSDLADAKPILLRLQQIIHRDQPMTFMWESKRVNGVSRRLHGTHPNLLSAFWYLRLWWLEPPS